MNRALTPRNSLASATIPPTERRNQLLRPALIPLGNYRNWTPRALTIYTVRG